MSANASAVVTEAWSPETYDELGVHYLPMAAGLVEATEVGAAESVLDVGCGTGSVAITAGSEGAEVVGLDPVPGMLERARERADRAGVGDVAWQEGTATDLPFDADAFDVTLSALGHIFGDPPDVAGAELVRVTRPGGRIGFTSWTAASVYPSMAARLLPFLDPGARPDYSEPPFMWGDESVVERRLGDRVGDLACETASVTVPALSPRDFWERVAGTSGVFARLLEAVDDRDALRDAMLDTVEPHFDRSRNVVELEYLRTTATVR